MVKSKFFDNSQYFILDKELITSYGNKVNIYKLTNELLEEDILNKWATSLRNNYIEEELLPDLISGTGLTQQEYLKKNILPDFENRQGAGTMSGEFGEILIYDYINFNLKYYITRTRYLEKVNPNMPISGSDVIGYKMVNSDIPCISDELIVYEVKTRSSMIGKKVNLCQETLEAAIKDSSKDRVRLAESLNAEKRRLLSRFKKSEAKIVERFQNKTDYPFILNFFAVAVLDTELCIEESILEVIEAQYEIIGTTNVLIIHSKELKSFLRDLYRRACEC